ncbi:MAG: alpha-ketoacid dehydrogenase subunit beta [Firmicutes bacterium]|nr:alpha-ketoacid dehydrogenase subunit beta [Bacillota bacterium]
MREITFSQATLEAMAEEMRRDPTVFVLGEDIARQGGIFGQFKGLPNEFGYERVLDTPISETAIVGSAVGAALTGMRPVADMHFADFVTCAMDEIANQAAKIQYMFGGQARLPLVVRAPDGVIKSAAAQHSQSLEAWFVHVPGLKIVIPSTPYDAKGLLKAAIRDDNPVLYFEHKALFAMKGPVPEEEYIVPIGKADVKRPGRDVTCVTYSIMVHRALEGAEDLARDGIEVEVVDLRTLVPMDIDTVLQSVRKTKKVVVAHEACRRGGAGAEIAATIAEEAFDYLDAPVVRVGTLDVPIPFSPPLEARVVPRKKEIVEAVRKIV